MLAINAYSLLAGSGTAAARTASVLVLTPIALWVLVCLVGALAVEVLFRFHRRGLNADPALPHSGTR